MRHGGWIWISIRSRWPGYFKTVAPRPLFELCMCTCIGVIQTREIAPVGALAAIAKPHLCINPCSASRSSTQVLLGAMMEIFWLAPPAVALSADLWVW